MWRSRTGPTGRTPAPVPGRQGAAAQLVVFDRHGVRTSADEEVEIATDLSHAGFVDCAELSLNAVVGQGSDLLSHGIRSPGQPGGLVRRHRHVVAQATVGAGEGHGQEQAGDDRVALVGHDDDGAPPALLTTSGGVQIREQDVARVQATPPLYSGYSSAAVSARSWRSRRLKASASAR